MDTNALPLMDTNTLPLMDRTRFVVSLKDGKLITSANVRLGTLCPPSDRLTISSFVITRSLLQ